MRCAYVEVTLDLGEYAWGKYKGMYPNAVGIKVYGLYGFDDVIWVCAGTDGHVKKWIYKGTVNYVPWNTNVRKDVAASIVGNAATLNVSGDVLLVTGVNAGTAELTVMLKSGQSKTYTITVKEAEKTT